MSDKMFEQIDKLNDVHCGLSHAHSLLEFLGDYFCKDEPDPNTLAIRYHMHGDLNSMALRIVLEQMDEIYQVQGELSKIWKAIKGDATSKQYGNEGARGIDESIRERKNRKNEE